MARRSRATLRVQDCWLYAVQSKADLARRLSTPLHKVEVEDLEAFAADAGNFKLFTKRIAGKDRPIQEPKRRLQLIHARIHKLLSRIIVPDYLHSAVRGRSYLSNARAHDPAVATIKIDVKKFFPSVPRARIFEFFVGTMRCRRDVAGLLAQLLTFEGRLPTGSSASPIIAYYAFKPMFDEIHAMAVNNDLMMTCYVDDMAISGKNATRSLLYALHRTVGRYGLKSHKLRFLRPRQPKIITGVCNTVDGQRVPNKLHLKIKEGFDSLAAAVAPEAKSRIMKPLLGRLEAAGQIDPKFHQRARTLRRTPSL